MLHLIHHPIGYLICILSFGYMAPEFFIASLPTMGQDFHVTADTVQMTVAAGLLGASLGGPLSGILSDSWRRRSVFNFCILIFGIGSFLCSFSPTFIFMILSRILQGIGSGGVCVVGLAILKDASQREDLAYNLTIVEFLTTLSVAVGPTLGAFFEVWLHWRWGFSSMGIILSLFFIFFSMKPLRNIQTRDPRPLSAKQIFLQSQNLLRNPRFLFSALLTPVLFSIALFYLTVAPFYYTKVLNLTPLQFGLVVPFFYVSYFIANFIVNQIIRKVDHDTLILTGLGLAFSGALFQMLVHFHWSGNVILVMLPMALHQGGMAVVYAPSLSRTMEQSEEHIGGGLAIRNLMINLGAAIGALMAGFTNTLSLLPVTLYSFVLLGGTIVIFRRYGQKVAKKT